MTKISKSIAGKLLTHQYLSSSKNMKQYLPHTMLFNRTNLENMLSTYPMLYIKPDAGALGKGIYRVEKQDEGYQLKSSKQIVRVFTSIDGLYRYVKRHGAKRLIIQQGINLATVNGKRYDIRSMMQRKRRGKWTNTGIFAKVGKKNKIVTNYFQGGKILLMNDLFSRLKLSPEERRAYKAKISKVSFKVAHTLSSRRSGMYQMGIDFAYDQQGRLWILEVNSRHPQFGGLKNLDRAMYNRMLAFARSIGRRRP